jgi:RNA polymerase sigma factor (sigma-70 family)
LPTSTRPQHAALPTAADSVCALSDEQLVAHLRQGRVHAFEILAERYQARLLRFCWNILHSKEDAEDALQDVLVSAFRSLAADDRQISVRPWLYEIARNRCINELRRSRKVHFEQLDDEHPEGARSVIEAVSSREQFRELVDDVHALPGTQSTALLLREFDGCAYQQIATAMDTTVPGVKSLLVRARAGLRASATSRDARLGPRGPTTASERACATAHRTACAAGYKNARAAANVIQ